MELTVENYRGLSKAAIELVTDPDGAHVTRLAGPNGSGKSATIQALQCLLTGKDMPFSDVLKKDAGIMVRFGAEKATATLKWNDKKATGKWPQAKVTGDKWKVSTYAAGMDSPLDIPTNKLSEILGILPSKEDFDKEMENYKELDLPIKDIWDSVVKIGWEKSHSQAVERRKELKREWSALTGREYAPTKLWLPEHYSELPLEDLQASLASAEKIYQHAIKTQALDDKAKADLEVLAKAAAKSSSNPNGTGSAAKALEDLNNKLSEVLAQVNKTKVMISEVPKILNAQQAYKCWNCNELGCLSGTDMIKPPDSTSEADAKATNAKLAELNTKLSELNQRMTDLSVSQREAFNFAEKCEEALKELTHVDLEAEPSTISIEDAKNEIELAKKRIQAHHDKEEYEAIDEGVKSSDLICSILDPEGLRKQILSARLASFNELLAGICDFAEWPLIYYNEYLEIRFRDKFDIPLKMVSTGQMYAAKAAIQLAIAKMDGSEFLIFDDTEFIVESMRKGLMTVLTSIQIPSVVGFACDFPSELDEVENLGPTYWANGETLNKLEGKVLVNAK